MSAELLPAVLTIPPVTVMVPPPRSVAMALELPPTFTAEVTIAGDGAPMKMKGCGLAVLNPPWQIEQVIAPLLPVLAELLAQMPGGSGQLRWLKSE